MKRYSSMAVVLLILSIAFILISCNVKISDETQLNTNTIESTEVSTEKSSKEKETTVTVETESTEIETTSHTHSFGEWTVVKQPTCELPGSKECYCSCGEKKTETIPATGHTPLPEKEENHKDDSCVEAGGYDKVVRCSVCGEILSSSHVTTGIKLDHTPDEEQVENKIAPTCTENGGYDVVCRCKVCGEIISTNHIETPATGHKQGNRKFENMMSATCTEDGGYDIVYRCSICDEILSSTHTVTKKATGHKTSGPITRIVVEPTCTNDGHGFVITECTKCGIELSKELKIFPATGHVFEDGVCKKCGAIKFSEGLEIVLSGDKTYAIVKGIGSCTDKDVKIPDTYEGVPVTKIGESAFEGRSQITSLTIPSSINEFGSGAVFGCNSLKKVYVSDWETWLNIRFTSWSNPLIFATEFYVDGKLVTDIVIPDGTDAINDCMFDNYDADYTIVIPDTVKSIGYAAFYQSDGLHEIVIPDSVTTIGREAFWYCTNLSNIVLGNGITSIDENAFIGCDGIKTIYYTGTSEQFSKIQIGEGNDILHIIQIVYDYQPQ